MPLVRSRVRQTLPGPRVSRHLLLRHLLHSSAAALRPSTAMTRILCVAEKPSIAKAVAGHLSGGRYQTSNTRDTYIKNYAFDFDFGPPWGNCSVVMTAVKGHLTTVEFPGDYKQWDYPPPERLFDAPIMTVVASDSKSIAKNIEDQARHASALVIWTDCDREGEHIGSEIRDAARKGNARIQVKRARFSNVERAHILSAARRLTTLDERQVEAVSARIELDLRIGYAFTRFLTLNLRPLGGPLSNLTLSYGSCQFPTLGFVVDRYFRVKNFVPEPFWGIKVMHERDGMQVNFNWSRHRLFDRMSVVIFYERCLAARTAKVTKVQEKPTRKWKPLPLTTVELQKMATRFLRMSGQQAMTVAEKLYNKGFISYPRTETDRFDKGMDLRALVRKQTQDSRWGSFAQALLDGAFQQPREGKHDDKAHPPIHPITYAAPTALDDNERRVYELVTRRFLACCSEDARGMATDVEILYGDETFTAHGVIVLERNYLDVYPYENWTGTAQLPRFTVGERFEPTEAMAGPRARGGRGRGRGRGGRGSAARGGRGGGGGGGVREFIPTSLGVALIEGFDRMHFETSLGKPFLRKEMELKMKAICEGRTTKQAVLRESLSGYRQVYEQSKAELNVLKAACRQYVFQQQNAARGDA
ncbi:hypothetical protein VTH06DRAFT_3808 [Thermothelomyces fergusii]